MTTINVKQADELTGTGGAIHILGSPKTGKTVLACTASKFAPKPLKKGAPKTVLADVGYVLLEPNGLMSAGAFGLIPKHVLDVSGAEYQIAQSADAKSNELLLDWEKIQPALLAFSRYVRENKEIKIVVIDHLSAVAIAAEAFYRKKAKDGFEVFRQVGHANAWLLNVFRNEGVLVIGLAHLKSAAAQDQEKLAAKAVGGDITTLVAALPAGAAGLWASSTDATIVTMRKKHKVGTETKIEHKALVASSSRVPAGNRWAMEGEVDSHLRDIIASNYPGLFNNK